MKKLINDPADVVRESVSGFALAHADLVTLHTDPLFLLRAGGTPPGRVAVVSGGGSGHEPLHGGFVGAGMLDAAVPGAVFTSPTPDQWAAAVRAADAGAGVLLVVKNYTGDVLNAEVALELLDGSGIDVRTVLVDDDVAVEGSTFTTGRRGVAGTLLVERLAGAAAQRGEDLGEVERVARQAVAGVRTMGVALSAPVVPHSGRESFDLPDDEIEVGVGIHGEPGRRRAPMARADDVAALLLDAVTTDLALVAGEDVLLLVNGMGGTPSSELYIVYGRARRLLEERGVHVARSLVGSYVTSLEMHGASVTVLRLTPGLIDLWDDPVVTAALRW